MSEWRKIWANGLPDEGNLQNQAIGWLRKGYRSLDGGTVVRFPRIWMSSGECRLRWYGDIISAILEGHLGNAG